ncbi:putative transmembrane protein ZNF593OS [Pseudochaenichthys georgianus]|uniref:putative transmembrane protein ZNF593OS n=1 Tax=Pseudochaenichthys georgianus TaxID=52239 RepID=UPI0039C07E50
MILRLGRLTPGYFRLLESNVVHHKYMNQRQVSGEVRMQPQSSFINPIAMTMATLGMGVSLYSARQMAERDLKHQ